MQCSTAKTVSLGHVNTMDACFLVLIMGGTIHHKEKIAFFLRNTVQTTDTNAHKQAQPVT